MAYYPMTHGKLDDAHTSGYHGKAWRPDQPNVPNSMMVAAELRQTEARDGPTGDAVALNNSKYIELPKNVTKHISGDRPRTICLWARIDKWENDARIFEYGRKAPQGELFGLRAWDTPGFVRDPRAAPEGGVHQRHGQPHRPLCRTEADAWTDDGHHPRRQLFVRPCGLVEREELLLRQQLFLQSGAFVRRLRHGRHDD